MPNFGEMTAAHFIYIPFALLIGLIAGYTLGARAVRAELDKKKRRMKECPGRRRWRGWSMCHRL